MAIDMRLAASQPARPREQVFSTFSCIRACSDFCGGFALGAAAATATSPGSIVPASKSWPASFSIVIALHLLQRFYRAARANAGGNGVHPWRDFERRIVRPGCPLPGHHTLNYQSNRAVT